MLVATLGMIAIIIAAGVGSLLLLLGFGTLFIAAFSKNKKVGTILLIIIGFSPVLLILLNQKAYYSAPIFLLPVIYSQFYLKKTKSLKKAMIWFWGGAILVSISLFSLNYFTLSKQKVKEMQESGQKINIVKMKTLESADEREYRDKCEKTAKTKEKCKEELIKKQKRQKQREMQKEKLKKSDEKAENKKLK